MRLIERKTAALCALLVLVLSACGGVGGGATALVAAITGGVGTGGTGIVLGAITGFGSLVVDGKDYSSATPQYFAGSEQSEAAETSSAAVGLGNQVQLQLDAQGDPASVIIEPALVGAVSQVGASQFVVNGTTVRVNDSAAAGPITYFSGLSGYSSLTSGMRVAVHGAYGVDANSQQAYIQATLIEQQPGDSTVYRLSGTIANLDVAAGTFQLGATTVQLSTSTRVLPSGTELSNGLWVNVWSNAALGASGELRAGVIRARTLSGSTGQVQVSGIVYKLSGAQFQVSGIAVDASASALASAVSGLRPGDYVVVQGQADASGSALVAGSIRAYATQPARVTLKGTITDFVNLERFVVRGVPVDAAQAQLLGAASGTSLRNGIYVEISGTVSSANGNVVSAATVFAPGSAPSGGTVNYRGAVSGFDAANGSFTLSGSQDEDGASVLVRLAPNVVYTNGSASQLVDGARVQIEATKDSAGIIAYGVFFRTISGPAGGRLETEGLAYGVTSNAFEVNGLTIQINGVVPQGGSLVNGTRVEVEFTQSGGQNLAQAIAVDR